MNQGWGGGGDPGARPQKNKKSTDTPKVSEEPLPFAYSFFPRFQTIRWWRLRPLWGTAAPLCFTEATLAGKQGGVRGAQRMRVRNPGQGVARDGVEGDEDLLGWWQKAWKGGNDRLLMYSQQCLSSAERVMEGRRIGRGKWKELSQPNFYQQRFPCERYGRIFLLWLQETNCKINTAFDHKDKSLNPNGSHTIISFWAPWGPGLTPVVPVPGGPDKEAHSRSDGDTVPTAETPAPWHALGITLP